MHRFFARPAILISAVIVLVLLLGIANYGVLLHERIVSPPNVDVTLGRYSLKSWVDYDPPCGAHPYCEGARTQVFYVSLFVGNPAVPARPKIVQFIRLPLASP